MPSSLRQPTRRVPLGHGDTGQAASFGMVGLTCRAILLVEREGLPPLPVSFFIDTGASFTLIGLRWAAARDIPAPPDGVEEFDVPLMTAGGRGPLRVRPGRVNAWWNEGSPGYRFSWPALFVPSWPLRAPPLLGLGGVVNTCRWTVDGTYTPTAPWGSLALDDLR